jgi:hypothetical protein
MIISNHCISCPLAYMLYIYFITLKYCNRANFWYNVKTFRGGAAVAQSPVKRLVVGSNPTRGAESDKPRRKPRFCLYLLHNF